jgi:nucleotide-binding universal stress UspA family protein
MRILVSEDLWSTQESPVCELPEVFADISGLHLYHLYVTRFRTKAAGFGEQIAPFLPKAQHGLLTESSVTAAADQYLDRLTQRLRDRALSCSGRFASYNPEVMEAETAPGILAAVQKHNIDLLVLGKRRGPADLREGNLLLQISLGVKIPVLVLPSN